MKIQITNGNPVSGNTVFEEYLFRLQKLLIAEGHSVTRMDLRDMDLRGCSGCWGCWVKTPGECVQADDGPRLRRAIIGADFHLMASPLQMGFPSVLLKTALDKCIPLIHPYFAVEHGEAHHRQRYGHYPRIGLLVQPEPTTDAADLQIVGDIFSRSALNMKSKLEFLAQVDRPLEELASLITAPAKKAGIVFADRLDPTVGQKITSPARLTIFNGSPRGKKGNTPILLSHFARGFESLPGKTSQVFDLNRIHDREIFRIAFGQAECVLLGFPLYVDAMPGQVKAFIESLVDFTGRENNPPLGFLVQSGFPEAVHSRHVERYLKKLSARLRSPYLGTIVKGGAEGVRLMPEKMNAGLFDLLSRLGQSFGETGEFDGALLRQIAGIEKYPGYLAPVFSILSHTSILNGYWDSQLKENGVFEQRFAMPYNYTTISD